MAEATTYHLRYRPKTLDEVLGHEKIVAKLKGMIARKKFPSAMLFLGPTSSGKTTLAYAFAADVLNSQNVLHHPSFTEVNAGDKRSIEEMRDLIALARRYPMDATRRLILIDEFQQLLSNAPAVSAILKPLEHPVPTTTWILASMEPEKFRSTANGKAILTRCQQFVLDPPTPEVLRKQLMRIVKGEKLTFFNNELADAVIQSSDSLRTLANKVEALANYYSGLDKQPEKLKPSDVEDVLSGADSSDDRTAIRFLAALYSGKFVAAQKEVLEVQDGFSFMTKLLWLNSFLLNDLVLNGVRHRKVWATSSNVTLKKVTDDILPQDRRERLSLIARVQYLLIQYKSRSVTFSVADDLLLTSLAYEMTLGAK